MGTLGEKLERQLVQDAAKGIGISEHPFAFAVHYSQTVGVGNLTADGAKKKPRSVQPLEFAYTFTITGSQNCHLRGVRLKGAHQETIYDRVHPEK